MVILAVGHGLCAWTAEQVSLMTWSQASVFASYLYTPGKSVVKVKDCYMNIQRTVHGTCSGHFILEWQPFTLSLCCDFLCLLRYELILQGVQRRQRVLEVSH